MTLTEALQETKTLKERIQKKRERLVQHLCRNGVTKDLLEKEGGQEEYVRKELQSIGDLETELIRTWHSIAITNASTKVTVENMTQTIEDWIRWKANVAPQRTAFLEKVLKHVESLRTKMDADRRQYSGNENVDPRVFDLVVNFDEKKFREELEHLEKVTSSLDAKLSVKNATTEVLQT